VNQSAEGSIVLINEDWTVRGLRLPDALVSLLRAGLWRDPSEAALREVMPWFEDPLSFLPNVEQIRRESRSLDLFADDERLSEIFRERRGSTAQHPVELPWLDPEQAVLVAVNRHAGDDVAVALDYRSGAADPRVVASDFWTDQKQCAWRVVAPSFTQFATRLGLC
jgi:hypothetical protein